MPVHLKMLEGRSSWDVLLTMCGPYAVKYVCSQICVAVKYVSKHCKGGLYSQRKVSMISE